jgi:hypothetical protein
LTGFSAAILYWGQILISLQSTRLQTPTAYIPGTLRPFNFCLALLALVEVPTTLLMVIRPTPTVRAWQVHVSSVAQAAFIVVFALLGIFVRYCSTGNPLSTLYLILAHLLICLLVSFLSL